VDRFLIVTWYIYSLYNRLHMQHKIDSDFNDIEIIKRFSKYTEVVHLWNVKLGGIGHFPALPNLKTEDGFAPIEDYLKIIREENKNVKILFEHRSDLISDEELDSCYSWISDIFEQKE
jgi:D-mannonate dehydratase